MSNEREEIKVPNKLKSEEEAELLGTAFKYLFQIEVAKQTKTPFAFTKGLVAKGHRLIKKHFPRNFFYDVQYMRAKTRLESYLHTTSVTMRHQRMALQNFGACFLLARLEQVARTGEVPKRLTRQFYFLPKGSFTEEFEQLQKVARENFIKELSPADEVKFHSNGDLILNELPIQIDTSTTINLEADSPLFPKVGVYRARFGERVEMNLEEV